MTNHEKDCLSQLIENGECTCNAEPILKEAGASVKEMSNDEKILKVLEEILKTLKEIKNQKPGRPIYG